MDRTVILLTIVTAVLLIALVIVLPRESQRFYTDRASVGRSGYWESRRLPKLLLLGSSITLFVLLFFFKFISL